jgi:hypothetical protein
MQEKSFGVSVWVVLAMIVVAIIGGLMFLFPAYGRYQARAEAENQVAVNNIRIQQTAQLVQVEKQKADIRIAEANGIAESQAHHQCNTNAALSSARGHSGSRENGK